MSNTATTLTVAPSWDVVPDQTSSFVIVDNTWQFGALSTSSPAALTVPNRAGATVEICGRAASVHDLEAAYELSPVVPWRIGGAGASGDADVPPEPVFALTTKGQGVVEVTGIGFGEFPNTASISGATLTVHYVDEVLGNPSFALAGALDAAAVAAAFTGGVVGVGNVLLCGSELLRVLDGPDSQGHFAVERGAFGSPSAPHATGDGVIALARRSIVLPFVKNFFGSAASGAYSYPVRVPNVRIAAAEMFATNGRGNGLTHPVSFTNTVAGGLRTLVRRPVDVPGQRLPGHPGECRAAPHHGVRFERSRRLGEARTGFDRPAGGGPLEPQRSRLLRPDHPPARHEI